MTSSPHRPRARQSPVRFGIKQKILLVLAGVLTFTLGLVALLASYYTNRQNEDAALAALGNDLRVWDEELEGTAVQLRKAALAVVGDQWMLNELAQTLTLELQGSDPAKAAQAAEMARTLAYSKTVSLAHLYLMLRTGAFSSIAVYSNGRLSHYVSSSEAGMSVRWGAGDPVWIRAAVEPNGELPFQSWPSWDERASPASVALTAPEVQLPVVLTHFPTEQTAAIDVVVPVQGNVREFPHWLSGYPVEHVVSDLSIGGSPQPRTGDLPAPPPRTLAVVVFRKLLDRTVLQGLARKTGKWPVLASLDGAHRQELMEAPLIPVEMLRYSGSSRTGTSAAISQVVRTDRGSFYVAAVPWRFEGQPRFMLGFALSRESTLHNVRQTVTAILILAGLILVLSVANGAYWFGRLVAPIIALTDAVKKVRPDGTSGAGQPAAVQLQPITVRAPDEIGDLAAAFNTMVAELQRSFETLEQRVLDRTAQLHQQTRYVRTLLDTLPLWVGLKDTRGRYLAVNEPLARLCGLESPEQMVGKLDSDLWEPQYATLILAEDAEVIKTKRRMTLEEQPPWGSREGTSWIERFRAPVLDEDGTVLGIVVVSRDITVSKAAESAREGALSEAMRLAQMRSEFLARMSHELRTPLNSILGYAQILQHDRGLTERQARGLAIIRSGGEHLLTLINDILDLARIDAARLELVPTELDLTLLLQTVADSVRIKAQEKELVFRHEVAGVPPAVWVDGKRLRQVLLNLLGNAVKFTDAGEVWLRVRRLASSSQNGAMHGVFLRFQVQDTGIGIGPEQLARLFQPFEQLGDAPRREGGTGLGLAISQQLVQLMGGRIRVESQSGRGSVFSFDLELPVAAGSSVAATPQAVEIGYEGRRRSILVVDDVMQNRAMLTDTLVPLGFEVFSAGDGREALAEAARVRPDLILMDVMMPVMDGLEATRRLRRQADFAATPIIAVSASAGREEVAHACDAGADLLLAKPLQREELLQAVKELLGLSWVLEEPAS